MRILAIGDIIAQPGIKALQALLPRLRKEHEIDLVIANGENAAFGLGITIENAKDIFSTGVDVITSGNHIWDRKEIVELMDAGEPVLRPLNYPDGLPGRGFTIHNDVMVVSLLGRNNLENVDCPFTGVTHLLDNLEDKPKMIVVDFHALEPFEKMAMGWHLNGKVSAVLGTHTHIPTSDARVLPDGTAYVSDIGMVGPLNSVAGVEIEPAVKRFVTRLPPSYIGFKAAPGPVMFNSVMLNVDEETGKAINITRLDVEVEI
ncbi:MAG: YmdB family metallophosphoesterase [Chloroflexi bacterium]|nr:YmdB family metallophosphoesterase [Chloroflexota bacterium]